jgi:ComF family protein
LLHPVGLLIRQQRAIEESRLPDRTLNIAKSILEPIVQFVYPPLCLACSGALQEDERLVCETCWQSIETVHAEDDSYQQFLAKLTSDGIISGLFSPFYFEKEGKLQAIIHGLKYQGYTSLGVKAGRKVGERIESANDLPKADVLLPVPLHPLKKRERGYNQSELICQGIEEVTRIPVRADLLRRRKYTVSQTQLSFEERKENVGDAFEINEKKRGDISGKSFILVDDVITTGSTINACAKALATAGAKSVHAAAIALAK